MRVRIKKMGKSAPKAPDYTAAAEATAASDKEALNMQTWANRADQYNPWGSLTYSPESVIDPATGQEVTKWTQRQELTPLAQEALDRQMSIDAQKSDFASQLMGRAGNTLLQDTDWGKFGSFGQAPVAYGMRQVGTTAPQAPQMPQEPQQPSMPPPRPDWGAGADNGRPITPPTTGGSNPKLDPFPKPVSPSVGVSIPKNANNTNVSTPKGFDGGSGFDDYNMSSMEDIYGLLRRQEGTRRQP